MNHNSTRRLAKRLMGSEGMRMGGRYLMSVEEYKHEVFCDRRSSAARLSRILESVRWIWILGVVIS